MPSDHNTAPTEAPIENQNKSKSGYGRSLLLGSLFGLLAVLGMVFLIGGGYMVASLWGSDPALAQGEDRSLDEDELKSLEDIPGPVEQVAGNGSAAADEEDSPLVSDPNGGNGGTDQPATPMGTIIGPAVAAECPKLADGEPRPNAIGFLPERIAGHELSDVDAQTNLGTARVTFCAPDGDVERIVVHRVFASPEGVMMWVPKKGQPARPVDYECFSSLQAWSNRTGTCPAGGCYKDTHFSCDLNGRKPHKEWGPVARN